VDQLDDGISPAGPHGLTPAACAAGRSAVALIQRRLSSATDQAKSVKTRRFSRPPTLGRLLGR
jgi:hypothetical protein